MADHPFDTLLASLPRTHTAALGTAFEGVAMWLLRTAPAYRDRVTQVWRWDEWPGRWGPDSGIDLVAETIDGDLWAVQAKGYDEAASLGYRDLSTFFAACTRRFRLPGTPAGDRRFAAGLLISSAGTLGAKARAHMDASPIPITHVLRDGLRGAAVTWPTDAGALAPDAPGAAHAPCTPLPHQIAARDDVCACLATSDRAQLLMACGTGKTLTALWIAEALCARRTLILVPSLALARQTVQAWARTAASPFHLLVVCSDESVADRDELEVTPAELGVPATTDADQVRAAMENLGDDARQVIVATYQSAGLIHAAQAAGAPRVDLMLCDEAHRMTGTGPFARALDDGFIGADKRVHMTATPRTFTRAVTRAAQAADVDVASMDDVARFGPVAHRLSFGQAISDDLLADYQVMVIGVDDRDVARMAQRGTVIDHPSGDARTLAAGIGVLRAMEGEDLRRVISFHGSVAKARRFAEGLPGLARDMGAAAPVHGDHVSGLMRTDARERRIARLRDPQGDERVLMANARCLTEGVDVPDVDGIAFIDPKSSEIDIIQAVGRAIRKGDGRPGTIILPVLIPDGADVEEILAGSAFRHIWAVLRALRAHDPMLGEELDALRRTLGSRTASINLPAKIRVHLPADVPEGFADALSARLIQAATSSWNEWHARLERYVQEHTSARAHTKAVYEGHKLGNWIDVQRRAYAEGSLDEDRRRRLEALPGWTWDTYAEAWDAMFACLADWVQTHGDALVPRRAVHQGRTLGQWVSTQRGQRLGHKMTPDRARRLESLPGWSWDPAGDAWDAAYRLLCEWAASEGHARVPQHDTYRDVRLGAWVNTQRARHGRGQLPAERAQRLEAVPGWAWSALDQRGAPTER